MQELVLLTFLEPVGFKQSIWLPLIAAAFSSCLWDKRLDMCLGTAGNPKQRLHCVKYLSSYVYDSSLRTLPAKPSHLAVRREQQRSVICCCVTCFFHSHSSPLKTNAGKHTPKDPTINGSNNFTWRRLRPVYANPSSSWICCQRHVTGRQRASSSCPASFRWLEVA